MICHRVAPSARNTSLSSGPTVAMPAATFTRMGKNEIRNAVSKGIRFVGLVTDEPPAVASVQTATQPAAGLTTASAELAVTAPDRPSIAVLPFQSMSGDPEQEYFADGVVEEIVTALSRMRF